MLRWCRCTEKCESILIPHWLRNNFASVAIPVDFQRRLVTVVFIWWYKKRFDESKRECKNVSACVFVAGRVVSLKFNFNRIQTLKFEVFEFDCRKVFCLSNQYFFYHKTQGKAESAPVVIYKFYSDTLVCILWYR